ncbi:MAG: hypothetical protein NE328_09965, partial [Lentisphaeraceae bacterium]|nr:hypothetical protein [Lentisphaeraceae bacterium]
MNKSLLVLLLLIFSVSADEFYKVEELKHPDKDVALEVGAMCLDPDGGLMMTTRRGEVWNRSSDG